MKPITFKFASLTTALMLGLIAQPALSHADDLDDAPEINTEYASANEPRVLTDLERPPHQRTQKSAQTDVKSKDLDTAPEYQNDSSGAATPTSDAGFYLRGALGLSLNVKSEQGQTGSPKLESRIGNAFQASGSLGYAFNDILRVEGEIGYLGHMEFKNIAGNSQKFDGAIFGVNAFADLGTIVGVTPYVGAGIGGAKFKGSDTRLRFNAQAGFAYKLNDKIALELGYEYSHIRGGALDVNGANFEQNSFDMHAIKLGTRIKF